MILGPLINTRQYVVSGSDISHTFHRYFGFRGFDCLPYINLHTQSSSNHQTESHAMKSGPTFLTCSKLPKLSSLSSIVTYVAKYYWKTSQRSQKWCILNQASEILVMWDHFQKKKHTCGTQIS